MPWQSHLDKHNYMWNSVFQQKYCDKSLKYFASRWISIWNYWHFVNVNRSKPGQVQPPSEITCPFMPCAASAHSSTALNCGYPTLLLGLGLGHTQLLSFPPYPLTLFACELCTRFLDRCRSWLHRRQWEAAPPQSHRWQHFPRILLLTD